MISSDIVVVRDGNVYRLLFGHLRLASEMETSGEISLDVKGEGKIRVVKARTGYFVNQDQQRIPLLVH